MTVQTRVGLPMDEFIRLYDEAPFELIDGERRLLVPPLAGEVEINRFLYNSLLMWESSKYQITLYSRTPFVLTDTPDWVAGSRVPDIMVYEAARMEAYKAEMPDWKGKPFVLVPDLCVEILSKNDYYVDMEAKVEGYLRDGVRRVWVVNPRSRTVNVYIQGSSTITRLTADDTLDGGEVLSGFAVRVGDLFGA